MKLLNSLLVLLSFTVGFNESLKCFVCHQTSKACISGDIAQLVLTNCSTFCVSIIYEADVKGTLVRTGLRGIGGQNQTQFCSNNYKFAINNQEQRINKISCKTCNQDFCNASSKHFVKQLVVYFLVIYLVTCIK